MHIATHTQAEEDEHELCGVPGTHMSKSVLKVKAQAKARALKMLKRAQRAKRAEEAAKRVQSGSMMVEPMVPEDKHPDDVMETAQNSISSTAENVICSSDSAVGMPSSKDVKTRPEIQINSPGLVPMVVPAEPTVPAKIQSSGFLEEPSAVSPPPEQTQVNSHGFVPMVAAAPLVAHHICNHQDGAPMMPPSELRPAMAAVPTFSPEMSAGVAQEGSALQVFCNVCKMAYAWNEGQPYSTIIRPVSTYPAHYAFPYPQTYHPTAPSFPGAYSFQYSLNCHPTPSFPTANIPYASTYHATTPSFPGAYSIQCSLTYNQTPAYPAAYNSYAPTYHPPTTPSYPNSFRHPPPHHPNPQ
ncbi:hypothetical protein DMENIID0001_080390 [Sergentomyia squamirostris]